MRVYSRHLIRQYGSIFLPLMAAFVALYLIVDFLDRLDILLRHDASASESLRYFLFKIPLMVTQIAPAAAMVAVLVSLGLMGRRNEIVALRACGISLWQMAIPLLGVGFCLSLAAIAWDEFVVPYASRQFEYVNNVEIRNRGERALLSDREIWLQGSGGFYHIDHVDLRRGELYGVTMLSVGPDFTSESVVEIRQARWAGDHWQVDGAVRHRLGPSGELRSEAVPNPELLIREPLSEFTEVQRQPEELSFLELRDRIRRLSRKGIDASNYLVDLYLKLALPFSIVALMLIGIPIAGSVRRNPSVAQALASGLVVGFAYWVVLGFARSLGESGVVGAALAAWAANAIAVMLGGVLFLRGE